MSGRRTPIYWPILVSGWALIALLGAVADESWLIVICAVLAAAALWSAWLCEGQGYDGSESKGRI